METRERSKRWPVDASASTSLVGLHKWQSGFWSRFRRRPTVLLGLTFLLALVLVALGADLIATGHYAQIQTRSPFQLLKGLDNNKVHAEKLDNISIFT